MPWPLRGHGLQGPGVQGGNDQEVDAKLLNSPFPWFSKWAFDPETRSYALFIEKLSLDIDGRSLQAFQVQRVFPMTPTKYNQVKKAFTSESFMQ
jgi:hypothetical protein